MKKNQKMGKKILTLGAIASMGAMFSTVSPELASATQPDTIQKSFQGETKAIKDWKIPLHEAMVVYGKNLVAGGREYKESIGHFNNVEFHYNAVSADGTPNISNVSDLFVGKTTLTNNSDQEQTLSTNSFSKTITDSVTTSTTHGFKIGEKTTGKISLPIGELAQEVSLEYNFSSTGSQTKTESYTYTATPQNIKVKPHSSVEVIVILKKVKATGKVNLNTKMSGNVMYNHVYKALPGEQNNKAYVHSGSMASAVRYAKNFDKLPDLSVNPDDTISLIGKGTYEAEVGSEFSVTVNPIDKKGRYTGEDYTYTVKPEVKKAEK
ncbi:TPA: ETX/MTX2 family pore-forming toxin [Bacillus cereus]|nr:ETX/MTX2 family pore-forming toxin [Bacillus cereus]